MTIAGDPSAGEQPSTALARGEERYRAGAYAEAAAIFEKLCTDSPGFPAKMRLLGLCKVRLGDPPGGLALLEKAGDFAPFDPHAQLHYGLVCTRSAAMPRRQRSSPPAAPIYRWTRRPI